MTANPRKLLSKICSFPKDSQAFSSDPAGQMRLKPTEEITTESTKFTKASLSLPRAFAFFGLFVV
jgi:hypothetical protein